MSDRAGSRGARDPAQEGLERERLTDSVDYIVLYARDLETSVAFYRDVVGLAVKLEGDGYVEFVTRGTKFGKTHRQARHVSIRETWRSSKRFRARSSSRPWWLS